MPYYDKLSKGEIFLGMRAIKSLPRDLALWIIEHREFSSLQDFIQKLPENYRKETVIRPLIEVGAFDNFDANRRKLVENLKKLLDFNSVFQTDLFSKHRQI